MKKISIIVPVYNVEKYLAKCIDSLLAQTYTNLEIILVNDGSCDNSLSICEQYARQDSRIVIVDKLNGGLSSARNAGLDKASGDYVGFVDSDDYVDKNMFEVLVSNMEKYDASVSQMMWTTFEDKVEFNPTNKCKLINKNIERYLLQNNNLYCVVRYLFDRRLIGDIRFDESMKIAEDQKFIYQTLINADSIVCSNYAGYFYYQNISSISHGIVKPNHYGDIEYRKELVEQVAKNNKKYAKSHLLNAYMALYYKVLAYGTTCEENLAKKYGKIVRNNFFGYMFLPGFSIKKKVAAVCCLLGDKINRKIATKVV